MKYKVKFKYEGFFETEVDADNEKDALKKGIEQSQTLDDDELTAVVSSTLTPVNAEIVEVSE